NQEGQQTLARLSLYNKFSDCFDIHRDLVTENGDLDSLISRLSVSIKRISSMNNLAKYQNLDELWTMAGFRFMRGKGYPFQPNKDESTLDKDVAEGIKLPGWPLFHGLFIPNHELLYPFFLFTHATAGNNRHVIASIQRQPVDDLSPENICWLGTKTKLGPNGDSREEDIVVPRKEYETSGIDDMLTFVRNITIPMLRFIPKSQRNMLWVARVVGTPNEPVQVFGTDSLYAASKNYCQRHGLVEISSATDVNAEDLSLMTSIDAMRIRKTNMFARYQDRATLSEIRQASQDGSFDVVVKHYLSSDVQHRQNQLAIAALQELLLSEIRAYDAEHRFQGQLVLNGNTTELPDNDLTNACANRHNSDAPGQQTNRSCTAHFKHCMGCRQSRVFREHLAAIQFMRLQILSKQNGLNKDEWNTRWGHHHARVEDCLQQWSSAGPEYAAQVIEAEKKAVSGKVFLVPLI
ncbi:hypothetical protein ACNO5E_25245, partial [Vibrio parahaemolyticus]